MSITERFIQFLSQSVKTPELAQMGEIPTCFSHRKTGIGLRQCPFFLQPFRGDGGVTQMDLTGN